MLKNVKAIRETQLGNRSLMKLILLKFINIKAGKRFEINIDLSKNMLVHYVLFIVDIIIRLFQ